MEDDNVNYDNCIHGIGNQENKFNSVEEKYHDKQDTITLKL